jgi:AcrR family transcriptional regulator
MLAAEAGVNTSLIRYYFLSKDGLYQQMLADVADVADEFQKTVAEFTQTDPDNPFEAMLRAHMSLFQHSPDIPKLLFKELALSDGLSHQLVIDNVAKPNQKFIEKQLKPLVDKNQLKQGFDPFILMMCSLSIFIMPHLLGDSLEQLAGVKLDAVMAEKIIWQNSQMIQFGFMKQQAHIHD